MLFWIVIDEQADEEGVRGRSIKKPIFPAPLIFKFESQSQAPVAMPLNSTGDNSTNDYTPNNFSNNFRRIEQWIQLVEFFRAASTPSVENSQFFSIPTHVQQMASSEAQYREPIWQTLPENEPSGHASLMEMIDPARGPGSSPTQQNYLLAPRMRTIPLPEVPEDIEERFLMRTTAGSPALLFQGRPSDIDTPPTQPSYPPAPRMRTIPLPVVADDIEEGFLMTTTAGSPALSIQNQPIGHPPTTTSDDLLHHDHQPRAVQRSWAASRPEEMAGRRPVLAEELRHHGSARPVVKPVLSDMPPYTGHCWGAHDDEDRSDMQSANIHFPQSSRPATNPPMRRMRLARPFGGILVVKPTVENQFVSVVDVQRMVIAWMRWEEPHVQYEGRQLTGRTMVQARNGMTREVDVWVWRGLTRDSETDLWRINL